MTRAALEASFKGPGLTGKLQATPIGGEKLRIAIEAQGQRVGLTATVRQARGSGPLARGPFEVIYDGPKGKGSCTGTLERVDKDFLSGVFSGPDGEGSFETRMDPVTGMVILAGIAGVIVVAAIIGDVIIKTAKDAKINVSVSAAGVEVSVELAGEGDDRSGEEPAG